VLAAAPFPHRSSSSQAFGGGDSAAGEMAAPPRRGSFSSLLETSQAAIEDIAGSGWSGHLPGLIGLEATRKIGKLDEAREKKRVKALNEQKIIEKERETSRRALIEPPPGDSSTEVNNNSNLRRLFPSSSSMTPCVMTADTVDLGAPLPALKAQLVALTTTELKQLIYGRLEVRNGSKKGGWPWKVSGCIRPTEDIVSFAFEKICESKSSAAGFACRNETPSEDASGGSSGGGASNHGSNVPEYDEYFDEDDDKEDMEIASAAQEPLDQPEVVDTLVSTALAAADEAMPKKQQKKRIRAAVAVREAAPKKQRTKSGRPSAPTAK